MASAAPQSFNTVDVEKGGALNGQANFTHGHPAPLRRIANPGGLGLFSFASTTLILSLYNLHTRGISHPNAVVGMAIFTGGLAQLLAGMWEFPRDNMFGATAFTSYGAFWMSYATILIPGSGILEAYKNPQELRSALGIYLLAWAIVTWFFFGIALRKSLAFIALFGLLGTTFLILAGGEFTNNVKVAKAGGGTGVVTAIVAYYIGYSELLAAEKRAIISLPVGVIKVD